MQLTDKEVKQLMKKMRKRPRRKAVEIKFVTYLLRKKGGKDAVWKLRPLMMLNGISCSS